MRRSVRRCGAGGVRRSAAVFPAAPSAGLLCVIVSPSTAAGADRSDSAAARAPRCLVVVCPSGTPRPGRAGGHRPRSDGSGGASSPPAAAQWREGRAVRRSWENRGGPAAATGPPGRRRRPAIRPVPAGPVSPPLSRSPGALMDAVFSVPEPHNEPVRNYEPGSAERDRLQRRLTELAAERIDLPMTIGGEQRMAGGDADRRRAAAQARARAGGHRTTPPTTTPRRGDGRQGRRADVAGAAVRRAGRDLPARRRPARRPVAGHAERGHHARPVEDRASRPRSTRPAS